MRVLVAPDKFKGSLTAREAARAMAEGVRLAVPVARAVTCPVADGGEGTVDAVVAATGVRERRKVVRGLLPGQEVEARWVYLPPGALDKSGFEGELSGVLSTGECAAVIEMAQASGLSPEEGLRDPMSASTVGTGELIVEALESGCRQIVVGMGGSGTVDGGTGMAVALGYRFLDANGGELAPGGLSLSSIRSIDVSGSDPRLAETAFIAACDVDNLLLGEQGAARVYGPQKGASPGQVEALERGLANMGELLKRELCVDVLQSPGAGAAGGLGAGLLAFCGARPISGFGFVAAVLGLRKKAVAADLVLTGEGSFDSQTARGKAPAGVVAIASGAGVPVVVVAGSLRGDFQGGSDGVAEYCVLPGPIGVEKAMRNADELVRLGTARLMRLIQLLPDRRGHE
ncbi:MAG: glycerate kinase [Actinobacteria bacterium]|nr:glycerate kinase [Actinomycetota bacterium]MBU4386006.1 glycerate kinase [Actinomycetota bacterium]